MTQGGGECPPPPLKYSPANDQLGRFLSDQTPLFYALEKEKGEEGRGEGERKRMEDCNI